MSVELVIGIVAGMKICQHLIHVFTQLAEHFHWLDEETISEVEFIEKIEDECVEGLDCIK